MRMTIGVIVREVKKVSAKIKDRGSVDAEENYKYESNPPPSITKVEKKMI